MDDDPLLDESDFQVGFFAGLDRGTAEALIALGVFDGDRDASEAFLDGVAVGSGVWHLAG